VVRVTGSLVLCVCLVDRCFFVLFWGLLCCLFFFDLRILERLTSIVALQPSIEIWLGKIKAKDRATWTSLKTGRNRFCFSSGTSRVTVRRHTNFIWYGNGLLDYIALWFNYGFEHLSSPGFLVGLMLLYLWLYVYVL
jgi:hypothetical protein